MKKAGTIFLIAVLAVAGIIAYKTVNGVDTPESGDRIVNTKTQTDMESQHTNHLAESFSPYLRQHMHNPVDWHEWNAETLEEAKREDKPILVSVGYSTCYWCHVLERETFAQEDAAAIMNEHFVSIKVDREVRPDIDEIYMTATQLMTGSGGWPNNVVLTPDLKPFYAVTYLPKAQWMEMTQAIGAGWKSGERSRFEAQASRVDDALQNYLAGPAPVQASIPAARLAGDIAATRSQSYDSRYGGFGAGTKFPQETGLLFLLDYAALNPDKDDGKKALSMVKNTVDHMISGGIHDHVGGGFHRYATENRWLLPHFEKMLYNQGLMAVVLARLYESTQEPEYRRALESLLSYVGRQMTNEGGAFYSALDAETDAVEGAYYVWNEQELETVLGKEDKDYLLTYYDLTPLRAIPGHKEPDGEVLYRKNRTQNEANESRMDTIFAKMLTARDKRKMPLRDDKILTAWNGMMIYGTAEAGRILDNPDYVRSGERAARFILENMKQKDGRLYRIYMNGAPHQSAYLEDYAWLAKGLMALYRASGDETWKNEAIALLQTADRYFLDKNSGGYFLTDGSENLPVRLRQADDSGALPSANSVMIHVLADLYAATGENQWQAKAESIVSAFGQGLMQQPYMYSHLVHGMMLMNAPQQNWLEPIKTKETAEATDKKLSMESKDKVNVQAHIEHDGSTDTRKIVKVTLEIEDGWHVNANPASLDFLIPTVVDIQTAEQSELKVSYPDGHKMETALGAIDTYEGTTEISATVESKEPIDTSKIRALVQVQACQGATCYPPSQIVVNLKDHHGC